MSKRLLFSWEMALPFRFCSGWTTFFSAVLFPFRERFFLPPRLHGLPLTCGQFSFYFSSHFEYFFWFFFSLLSSSSCRTLRLYFRFSFSFSPPPHTLLSFEADFSFLFLFFNSRFSCVPFFQVVEERLPWRQASLATLQSGNFTTFSSGRICFNIMTLLSRKVENKRRFNTLGRLLL